MVIRTRQHLAALTTLDEALVLIILRYAHELRPVESGLPGESHKKLGITDRELSMAEKLVEGMVDKWKPDGFKDDYHDDVLRLIQKKVKAGEVNTMPEHKKAPRAKAPKEAADLMDLLKQSLEGGKKSAKKHKPANDVAPSKPASANVKKTRKVATKPGPHSPTRKSA